jgi:hypothetical protein
MDMNNIMVILLVALLIITLYQTVTFAGLSATLSTLSSGGVTTQPSTASQPAPVNIPAAQPTMVGGC